MSDKHHFYRRFLFIPYVHMISATCTQVKLSAKILFFGLDKLRANGVLYMSMLRDCVTVARQTLTLFVRVRILLPQPEKGFGLQLKAF